MLAFAFRAALCAALALGCAAASAGEIEIRVSSGPSGDRVEAVRRDGSIVALRDAVGRVDNARFVEFVEAGIAYAAWDESAEPGARWVAITRDGGDSWTAPRAARLDVELRAGTWIPGGEPPAVPAALRAKPHDSLYLVQFETPGLEAWRDALRRRGVEVLSHVPRQAQVVRADPELLAAIARLPFVLRTARFEPGYRVEPAVVEEIAAGIGGRLRRYHLMTFIPGAEAKARLAADVIAAGGTVELETPNGYRLEATLTLEQVTALAHSPNLAWIDRWGPRENDMDLVRESAGSNYVEVVGGYAGQGVRGEVLDAGIQIDHPDFDGLQIHGPTPSLDSHGTSTYGIVFGNGNRDGDGQSRGLGHMPSKEAGWFYDYSFLTDRYRVTEELVSAPIFGVFQSNSWGDSLTRDYTAVSAEMDDIIWRYDVAIFQSQSNAGTQSSRPQAWAKNIVSVGAVNHYDTLDLGDDCWCGGASIGPAADGRIKPDLAYWYDNIFTTTSGGGYTSGFNGTSAATPIVAGISGLFFQMWSDNVLGNAPQGSTVFERRPHASTMKALLINTAEPYAFSGSSADLSRFKQGWGLPSARRFLELAPRIRVVDEENVLRELDVHSYTAAVPEGQADLKVTLVYTDRSGTTSAALHRINDVDLKVISPIGTTVFRGNVGLTDGNWSVSGGSPDDKNNVENVFVQNPAPGAWTIEVAATDLNLDQHVETPEVDQDYALVVSGATALDFGCATPPAPPTTLSVANEADNRVALAWTGTAGSRGYRVYRATGGCGGTFARIGATPADTTAFTDTTASGGLTYGYEVRSVEGCESEPTTCVEVVAEGACLLPPGFVGALSAVGADAAECGVTVSWDAAEPSCGGPVVYNVYRGTTPYFAPSPASRVASCVSGTSWVDSTGLTTQTTFHYLVRAEDLGGRGSAVCGGSGESNTTRRSALVRGPDAVLLQESFEGGLGGWTSGVGSPAATRGAWVADVPVGSDDAGAPANPAECANGSRCVFTERNKSGNPANGDVDDGAVTVTSPLIDASGFGTARLTLARWHYNGAGANDSGDRFEIAVSRDDGASWQALQTLSGRQPTTNVWTPLAFDVELLGPLTDRMRIRVTSADGPIIESIVESAIDDVRLEGAQACASAAAAPPGAVPPGSLTITRTGAELELNWGPDCGGGTGYSVYRGDLAVGWSSVAPEPGLCAVGASRARVPAGGGSYFFVVAPNDGTEQGSSGTRSDGSRRPSASAACYPAALPDACAP